MKRFSVRFLPWLLTACTVDTPIVHSEASPEDRLGAGLVPWCESLCDWADGECGFDTADTCVEVCSDTFTTNFIDRTESCTKGALRVMDCLEGATCSELEVFGACNLGPEIDRCNVSQGFVVCDYSRIDPDDGGGMGAPASCETDFTPCSDDRHYRFSCDNEAPFTCACLVNDVVTNSFPNDGSACQLNYEQTAAICGWLIRELYEN